MAEKITLSIDGKRVEAKAGKTILETAQENGIYVPHLCAFKELHPTGACRVCLVRVNGRVMASCTQPVSQDATVEIETHELHEMRRMIIEMLFAEGNHFCPCCEKSGDCELQALAYRFGIEKVRFPYQFPDRRVDAQHPYVYVDHNRCILCGRCIQAARERENGTAFEFIGRGKSKRVVVTHDMDQESADEAVQACPVGAILRKANAFAVPVGKRRFDHTPIGSEVESAHPEVKAP